MAAGFVIVAVKATASTSAAVRVVAADWQDHLSCHKFAHRHYEGLGFPFPRF